MLEQVNYVKHLNAVFLQFSKDSRLNPTHISLYMALFQIWNTNRFVNVFFINREEVMRISKIGSKSTYHRCIKELSHWNYILYSPSHNPFKGSQIKMFNFGTSSEQVMYPSRTEIETSPRQELVPIYKHIQTFKNNNKQDELNFENSESNKLSGSVPNEDNLQTSIDKNYDEPL